MSTPFSPRWVAFVVSAAMLLVFAVACGETKTIEVPGETVVVTKDVIKEVQVPGETVVVEKEVVKIVAGPERVVITEVQVPGKKYVTDPTTGKVVSAPEYGGTLTIRQESSAPSSDPWIDFHAGQLLDGVSERMAISDWGLHRSVYNQMSGEPPMAAIRGELVESWEIIDPLTTVYHIRKGVQWHDKAPMNGRALTAEDIEYSWHRLLGISDKYGFTEGPSSSGILKDMPIESITATDENTLVWKLSEPFFDAQRQILVNYAFWTQPREVIEEHGDYTDWKTVVGTGPWMITDMVRDSVLTYSKNPSYWGFDEKYPDNRLPYFDEVKALTMGEEAEIAALRTGKLDGSLFGSAGLDLDEAIKIKKSNPEMTMWPYAYRSVTSFAMNVSKRPFDDIRVRHAMQMALNLREVNETIYSGLGIEKPYSMLGEGAGGFYTPFEQWPEELQGFYTYNQEAAEKLLDEAGYPRGKDGIRFTTKYWNSPDKNNGQPLDLEIVAVDYWDEIGVKVEFDQAVDKSAHNAMKRGLEGAKLDGMASQPWGYNAPPMLILFHHAHSKGAYNYMRLRDEEYDGLVDAATDATTAEEQERLGNEANMRLAELHVVLWYLKVPTYAVAQPWLAGYNGEYSLSAMRTKGSFYARIWNDWDLKEALGY